MGSFYSHLVIYNPPHRKTTVIVYKMFGIERAWLNQGSVGPRPRQMYLTKSPLLAEKVEEEYWGLWLSLADSDIPEYIRENIQRWDARKKSNAFIAVNLGRARDDLPRRFSGLGENHFPLFITIDTVSTILSSTNNGNPSIFCSICMQLCSLLEADVDASCELEADVDASYEGEKIRSQRKKPWDNYEHFVTPDVFKLEYWPHLHQGLTKGIGVSYVLRFRQYSDVSAQAPSLAFGAFLGTIFKAVKLVF